MIKNILTKRFFKKKNSMIFIYEIYTLSIDFYVKFIKSKIIFLNLFVELLILLKIYGILKDFS